MYGDKFIFTDGPKLAPGMSDADKDAAIADFFTKSGADNRILLELRDPTLREKVYVAGRRNYDRLLEEGKVIF